MTRGLMLHDADCGFCTRTAGQVHRLGVRVESAAIQDVDLLALGVDPVRAVAEMPFVHPDGRVDYGHLAWASVLRTGPVPCRLLGRAMAHRPLEPVARGVYRWVSRHRHRLPGGTAACALDDR